jgi:type VI secretion system protein ImpJ
MPWHKKVTRSARSEPSHSTNWGFSRLKFDPGGLLRGKLALLECAGTFPDGSSFDLPQQAALPRPLEIPSGTLNRVVSLTRPQRAALGIRATRAQSLMKTSPFKLAFAEQIPADWPALGVTRITDGRSDRDSPPEPAFIPPCLDYRVSPLLADFVSELGGLLHQRGARIVGRLGRQGSAVAANVSDFLQLLLINRTQPLLSHISHLDGIHPERLFQLCLALAGELASFFATRQASVYPEYRQHDLASCFLPLIADLRVALREPAPPRILNLPLQYRANGIHTATVPERLVLNDALFVLSARATLPDDQLVRLLPRHVKIAPVEVIETFINLQLPAIRLHFLPTPPRQLPFQSGLRYFALNSEHPLWSDLAVSAGIAIHVAGHFPGLQIGLWAIRSGEERAA